MICCLSARGCKNGFDRLKFGGDLKGASKRIEFSLHPFSPLRAGGALPISAQILCLFLAPFREFWLPLPRLTQMLTWKQKRRGGDAYMEKVSAWRFVLWRFEVSQTWILIKSKATVDVLGICSCITLAVSVLGAQGSVCIFSCGLLRCSFRLGWAMRDARSVGRVTGTVTHTFLYYVLNTNSKPVLSGVGRTQEC